MSYGTRVRIALDVTDRATRWVRPPRGVICMSSTCRMRKATASSLLRLTTSQVSRFKRIEGEGDDERVEISAGWDADRVKRLIDYYEGLSEDEQVAEDEAAITGESRGQAVIAVPDELLPEIRRLLAAYQAKSA